MRLQVMIIAMVLSACQYTPVAHWSCPAEHPACPAQLVCIDECCGGPPCGTLLWRTPEERPGADLGLTDLRSGSPGLSLGPAPGCASGTGYTVPAHPNVAACPGAWPSGLLTTRCADNWFLCKTVPADFCTAGLPGFFMSQTPVSQPTRWPPDSTLRCTWDGSNSSSPRGMVGCGTSAGGETLQAIVIKCQGLPAVEPCDKAGWHCPAGSQPGDSDFISVANDNEQDGVLCCR